MELKCILRNFQLCKTISAERFWLRTNEIKSIKTIREIKIHRGRFQCRSDFEENLESQKFGDDMVVRLISDINKKPFGL